MFFHCKIAKANPPLYWEFFSQQKLPETIAANSCKLECEWMCPERVRTQQ